MKEGVKPRYIVSMYENVTIKPPVQLIYANKMFCKKNKDVILE
jgi:hypothetical protein